MSKQSVEHLKDDPRRDGSAVYQAHDEPAWRLACERLMTTHRQLGEVVAGFSDQEMDAPYVGGKAKRHQVVQGLIAHNGYHTNEIISIRHMLGLRLERAWLRVDASARPPMCFVEGDRQEGAERPPCHRCMARGGMGGHPRR